MKQFCSWARPQDWWFLFGDDDLNPKQVVTSGPSNPWTDIEINVPAIDRNLEDERALNAEIDEIRRFTRCTTLTVKKTELLTLKLAVRTVTVTFRLNDAIWRLWLKLMIEEGCNGSTTLPFPNSWNEELCTVKFRLTFSNRVTMKNVTIGKLTLYGKFESKSLTEDIPSNGMVDGNTSTILIGPTIGAKKVNSNEAFKLRPVIAEYTQMVKTEDSYKAGDSAVTEKMSLAEVNTEEITGNNMLSFPNLTLIWEPDETNKFLTKKAIVETEVDCLPGNDTNTGAEIDEATMQYEMEHSAAEGGSLAMERMFAM
jgi:hypothetical protein